MSIRYLHADGIACYFDSLKQLFDPRYNLYFSHERTGGLHPAKMTSLLNTLYCRQNLEQYEAFKHMLLDGRNPNPVEHEHFLTLSQDVPAEQHWVFHMLRRNRGYISTGEEYRIFFPRIVGNVSFSQGYSAFEVSNKLIENPTPEQFVQFVNEIHDNWSSLFFSRAPEGSLWSTEYLYSANQFISLLISYTTGNNCIFSNTFNSYCTPKQFLDIIDSDSNIRFELDIHNREVIPKFFQIVSQTNRRLLYSVMNYTADVLQLLPYPNKSPKEKDPILVGVELEVATDYSMQELVDAATEPFFIGKQDASITGSKPNKVELVTAPSSFKYLKRAYAQWLNNLDYSKFDTTTTTNNGMHVHVGREHFEDNTHIRNFCWFFNNPANSDFLIYLSERGNYEAMMRYSPFYQFPAGCTRTKAFRQVYNFLGAGFRGITNFKGGWDHAKTVEVRMFRGVVSYASIVKNLEFVEAIFHFTKGLTSYRQLSLSGFLYWLKETPPNKYILLKKYIDMGDMRKMTAAADVKDILFNETDEEKIIRLLENSTLKITNEHISVLNRGKKRTFQLDKTTGEITIIYHNRSKLQPLDKSFAARYLR